MEGVDSSIRRGDPIIAYGQLRTNEYRTKDGTQRHDLEMRAAALGPDLGRCSAPVVRRGNSGGAEPAGGVDAPTISEDAPAAPGGISPVPADVG